MTHRVLLACLTLMLAVQVAWAAGNGDAGQFDVVEMTIGEAREGLRSGRFTCRQLTARHLARISAYDQTGGLNAIAHVNPNAMRRAETLDRAWRDRGEMAPLHCMPVILKDNMHTADMPTEAGAIALQGFVPPEDAFIVKRLREAGAIVVAKSNMGEWAFSPFHTISSTRGETRNAYDPERVPAGSSGGTASAIAAAFGIIGLGTDTGNSIRGPAAHLALVGLRPTLGATSRQGIVPLLLNRDIAGPMTRTVEDAAITFSVIAGHDPADPLTRQGKERLREDYRAYLDTGGLSGARLGVMRELYETADADPEVMRIMEQALDDLREAGAVLVDPFEVFDFEMLRNATGFCSRFRFDLDNHLRDLGDAAPVRTLDEIVSAGRYLEHNERSMAWAMGVDVPPHEMQPPCVDVDGDPRRRALLDAVLEAMDEQRVDAVLYPTWSNPPRGIGDLDSPHGNNSPVIAPHTGQPAITVPMGFTASGLPLGLQFLARPFDEHVLFRLAYAYEQHTQHRRPPARFKALSP